MKEFEKEYKLITEDYTDYLEEVKRTVEKIF